MSTLIFYAVYKETTLPLYFRSGFPKSTDPFSTQISCTDPMCTLSPNLSASLLTSFHSRTPLMSQHSISSSLSHSFWHALFASGVSATSFLETVLATNKNALFMSSIPTSSPGLLVLRDQRESSSPSYSHICSSPCTPLVLRRSGGEALWN